VTASTSSIIFAEGVQIALLDSNYTSLVDYENTNGDKENHPIHIIPIGHFN
jgi:hypothetical protein